MNCAFSLQHGLLLGAALLIHNALAGGKPTPPPPLPASGTLVLDWTYPDGSSSLNYGITVSPSGTIYASGNVYAPDAGHGVVLASTDGGSTWWMLLDDVVPGFWIQNGGGIVCDAAGNLYVARMLWDLNLTLPARWIVRRSVDNGSTWTTVDDFEFPDSWGLSCGPTCITADSARNIYVGGQIFDGNQYIWIIRKGVSGTSFSTLNLGTQDFKNIYGLFAHPTVGLLAGGQQPIVIKGQASTAWSVRRSADAGGSWQTIDLFQLSNGYAASPKGIGSDAFGNIYVVGSATILNKGSVTSHWAVRKSTNGGTFWATDDNFQLETNNGSWAACFISDSNRNLYVAGGGAIGANDGTGQNSYWVVRKKSSGATAWTTIDAFQHGSSGTTVNGIAAAAIGNVFVGGSASSFLIKKY